MANKVGEFQERALSPSASTMKRLEVVIPPWSLDEFKEATLALRILEFTVVEVQHSSSAVVASETRLYRGREYTVNLLPRLKVEFVLSDDDVKASLEKLAELAHPESIAVFNLDQIVNVDETSLLREASPDRTIRRSSGGVPRQIGGMGP
jgi:nitrogen regulatory protein P-II 1